MKKEQVVGTTIVRITCSVQKWGGDITCIPTDEGWFYTASVKDLCLKKI